MADIPKFLEAEARRAREAAEKARAEKPMPQRPQFDLVPFQHKDPNAIIARLERERTVAEDRLNDAQLIITAQAKCIAEWEAWAGVTPDATSDADTPAPTETPAS